MQLGKMGVWLTPHSLSPDQLRETAQQIESLGYSALWYPESRGYESFALGSYLLAQTQRLILATGIANIYARDPVTAKQGQHSLAKLSGGRFLLGLGVSHIPMVQGLRGHEYKQPVATMRAYLDAMDKAADAAPKLDAPAPTVLAALGPKMSALAAERTAGLHPYNVTPAHTAQARKQVGPKPWLCVEQKVMLEEDPVKARKAARAELARYMVLPNYRNNWLRLGFTEADLSNGGSDRFMDAMVAWGNAEALRKRVQEHFAAGATHVCVQPLRPDSQPGADFAALKALMA